MEERHEEGQAKGVSARCYSAFRFLLVVSRKLVINPNMYASLIGLIWALISFRYEHSFFMNWVYALNLEPRKSSLAAAHHILQVANTVTIDRQQFHKNTFRWRARDGDVQPRCALQRKLQVAYTDKQSCYALWLFLLQVFSLPYKLKL
jgi:hypothetical protein